MKWELPIRKYIHKVGWAYEKRRVSLQYQFGKYGRSFRNPDPPPAFTIGIVTYIVRFPLFKTLLKHIRRTFPQTPVIVAVNGYYRPEAQREYLARLDRFVKRIPDVTLIVHDTPRGLPRLWNEIILMSGTEKTFIVNDDIDIAPRFDGVFLASGILRHDMAIVNQSWSHFLIAKNTVRRVGWFDERLGGVGGEDWDYEARLAFADVPLETVSMPGILNMSIYTTDFSFGENVERVAGKYTMSSAIFLRRKWHLSDADDPAARYVRIWNGYVRPNPGFETPEFHDYALLKN